MFSSMVDMYLQWICLSLITTKFIHFFKKNTFSKDFNTIIVNCCYILMHLYVCIWAYLSCGGYTCVCIWREAKGQAWLSTLERLPTSFELRLLIGLNFANLSRLTSQWTTRILSLCLPSIGIISTPLQPASVYASGVNSWLHASEASTSLSCFPDLCMFVAFVFVSVLFFETISLCRPGRPGILCLDQVDPELIEILLPLLRLQTCITTPGGFCTFF